MLNLKYGSGKKNYVFPVGGAYAKVEIEKLN
jgi:hypothetical protein